MGLLVLALKAGLLTLLFTSPAALSPPWATRASVRRSAVFMQLEPIVRSFSLERPRLERSVAIPAALRAMRSTEVLNRVRQDLAADIEVSDLRRRLSANVVGDDVVRLVYSHDADRVAHRHAQAVARAYLQVREEHSLAAVRTVGAGVLRAFMGRQAELRGVPFESASNKAALRPHSRGRLRTVRAQLRLLRAQFAALRRTDTDPGHVLTGAHTERPTD